VNLVISSLQARKVSASDRGGSTGHTETRAALEYSNVTDRERLRETSIGR